MDVSRYKMATSNSTIRQIAQQTGVSVATVSRVLNNKRGISDKSRAAVLKAMNDAGYRAQRSSGTLQVALIYTRRDASTVLKGYESDLIAGVYSAVCGHQAQLAITNLADQHEGETYTQYFLRKHIDGVVLRVDKSSRNVALDIAAEGFPCVVVSDRFPGERVNFVDCDSRIGMARAMNHLAELGHRRIGLAVSALREDTDHADRIASYREGLERNGLDVDESLIITTTNTVQGGASAIDQFMAMVNAPTAIVCTNPPLTIGGIQRTLQRGMSIPGDLTIIGYDNSNVRHSVLPAYSAVCQDAEQIGNIAARAVLQRIQDRSTPPVQVVLESVFEINSTSGAPNSMK